MHAALEETPGATETTRLTGFVAKKDERGFGFIRTDDHRQYFFHAKDLPKGCTFEGLPLNKVIEFTPVDQTAIRHASAKKKHDRAVNIRFVA
jgi:hypothetical protein